MPTQVQVADNPVVVYVPPPKRGGRYRVEFPETAGERSCGHGSPHALLWLLFLEGDEVRGEEVTDVICSTCEPARFARVRAWASALA